MATIQLTRGLVALIDDADLPAVGAFKWYARPKRSANVGYYVVRKVKTKGLYLHRFLMDAPAGLEVDHINGNGLDNRRENLRLATRSQNVANRAMRLGRSGYRGVCCTRNKFRAYVGRYPNHERGPTRSTPEEAARDYDRIAFKWFGEFARLNFPAEIHLLTQEAGAQQ